MVYGYTLEEIYGTTYMFIWGRYHGLKHSPEIAREITKDTVLIILFFVANLLLTYEYVARDNADHRDWNNYYYSEFKTKRDNIPNWIIYQ